AYRACQAVSAPKGMAAASTWPTSDGLAARSAAGAVTYSAAAPGRSKPIRPYTSSPGRQLVTPLPVAATTPDRSWQGMTGQLSGQGSSPAGPAGAWSYGR